MLVTYTPSTMRLTRFLRDKRGLFFGFIMMLLQSFLSPGVLAIPSEADPELRDLLKAAISDTESFNDRFDAEVWLIDMSKRLERRLSDPEQRLNLLKLVHYEAKRSNLHPELVLAVIEVESNFDRWAISVVGARGLMQIMPFWLDEIGRPGDDLFEPATNLRMGCTILRHYLDKEKGDLSRALGRYNGSLGRMKYPNKVYAALRKRWYKP